MTHRRPRPVGFRVDATPAAVGEARRRLTGIAASWGVLDDDALDDLALCAAEVLANAAIHSGAPFVAAIRWTGTAVRVEVSDVSPVLPRLLTPVAGPTHDAEGGLGLVVLDRIAAAWGVTSQCAGKTVWFEVAPDGAAPSDDVRGALPSSSLPLVASSALERPQPCGAHVPTRLRAITTDDERGRNSS